MAGCFLPGESGDWQEQEIKKPNSSCSAFSLFQNYQCFMPDELIL
jgi:hypothetical protein